MSSWRPSEEQERFHIDSGPRINALQVVSEALDIQQQDEDQDCHDVESVSAAASSSTPYSAATKTIVASDSDVSNGFVKSGRSLPYVFEASESGVRKRSSKILPVCAVCGKRFVCVTTMKRHLVTHTGEKPFSCKVCGKQYTQKGNLRVHERTHRNDRPFECNICHQKFYRKEPMQKHQWRQHGIVHFKTRPTNSTTEQDPSFAAPTPATPATTPRPPTVNVEPPKPLIPLRPAKPTSYTALVDSLRASSREASPYRSDSLQHLASNSPPAAHQTQIDVPKFTEASSTSSTSQPPLEAVAASNSRLEFKHAKSSESSSSSTPASPPATGSTSESFSYSSILNETPNTHLLTIPATVTHSEQPPAPPKSTTSEQPIKLKMKMAYQREQHQNEAAVQNLDNDLHEMKIVSTCNNGATEMVECQCKTCGNTFSVVDPYNFRCSNCNVKYTSLPTHLIADPLQCIGCCMVFPHKPALKAHQTVDDKERPFRCCKCGYGFRQKAHLQKHQWRIHRRKLEPDPNMKEAEAFFEVIRGSASQASTRGGTTAPVATITMQDIINKSVEKSIGDGPRSLMKTSSKYYSEVLGLEYEPKSSSSEDDDSRDQPLDLSPAKKSSFTESRENNPLLNQPPLPLPSNATTSQLDYPVWKKQKTNANALASASSHTTLPPISGLQKPMSLVTVKNYKHSSWIPNEVVSITEMTASSASPSSKNSENNSFVRSQLELLKSSNARTV